MTRTIVTGLDIGTSSVRVAVCEIKEGGKHPEILTLVKKQSRGLRRGYIISSEEVVDSIREALADAERTSKTKIKRLLLGVGGVTIDSRTADGTVVVSRADLEISHNDIKRALDEAEKSLPDMANRHILHRIPLCFKVDGKKILGKAEEIKGEKLEVKVLFVTCSKQHIKDFVRVIEELGIIVDDIIASPLAASMSTLSKMQKASGCVLANIGSQTTSIAVFEEGIPLSVQIFPVGSTDITNDIALGFKISLDEAERVKRRESEPAGTKKKLDEIIEARISDVFDYIEMHLKKIGRSGLLPAGIVLTGGGSNIINIEDMAKDYFRLPAKIATPSRISHSSNQTIDSSWSVAYGLCQYDYAYEQEDRYPVRAGKNNFSATLFKWFKEFMP